MSKHSKLSPLSYWLLSHLRAFLSGLGELVRTPLASVLTLGVIGISMALPLGFYVLLQNFQGFNHSWNGNASISLYLKSSITPDQANALLSQLNNNPTINDAKLVSPEQGLQEFKKLTQFGDALAELDKNPLPTVIVLTPKKAYQTPDALKTLLSQMKNQPQVDTGQLDMAWVKRLYYLITLAKRIAYAMAVIFGIGVILITGNTIRLTTQRHQQEMTVLRLIGATPAFIRRPLLYRGLFYGCFGGLIAWVLVSAMLFWLEKPALALAGTYDNTLFFKGLPLTSGLAMLGICALLGTIGSWIAVQRHLRATEEI